MRYQEFKAQFKDFLPFSIPDIRLVSPDFHSARLSEWQRKGYIKKLRRGYYMFADQFLDEQALYLIANKLYSPSYVSFEAALSYYNLIPEGVYAITSVCGKKTARFRTPIAEFSYRNLKPELLFGYNLEKYNNRNYKMAEIEKAVLDYLYLQPEVARENDFYEWRFNGKEFLARSDLAKMRAYASAFKSKSLIANLEKLLGLIKHSP